MWRHIVYNTIPLMVRLILTGNIIWWNYLWGCVLGNGLFNSPSQKYELIPSKKGSFKWDPFLALWPYFRLLPRGIKLTFNGFKITFFLFRFVDFLVIFPSPRAICNRCQRVHVWVDEFYKVSPESTGTLISLLALDVLFLIIILFNFSFWKQIKILCFWSSQRSE